ncbi:MAG: hypothetical protein ACLUJR_14920 [Mediterraneibacter gnavus]
MVIWIASSIVDTVNTILQVQVFEAIDMPLDSSIHDVIQKLSVFIEKIVILKI